MLLSEKGSFARDNHGAGRPTTTRPPVLVEAVVHEIEQHPEACSRTIAINLHCSH